MKPRERSKTYLKEIFTRVQKHIDEGLVVTFDDGEVSAIDFEDGVYLKHDQELYCRTEIYSDSGQWEDMADMSVKEIVVDLSPPSSILPRTH